MGWKGTIRSIGTAVRAAERDAKRRQRELERQEKQYMKMQELDQAAYEVDVYENHIELIKSLHKDCSPKIDWDEIAKSKAPREPRMSSEREEQAKLKAENYRPGFFKKLIKEDKKIRQQLIAKIGEAQEADKQEFNLKRSEWDAEYQDWKESVEFAEKLLSWDKESKANAIEEANPFSEISNLGSRLSFSISEDSTLIEVEVHIHGDDIVPSEKKSLLQSGRLSVKKMPKGIFNEIYQDYVCSCVLRVANEVFAIVPDDMTIVTAVDELLNTQTGHTEKSPILSVCFSRDTLTRLNMDQIDPSDSMSNFIHNMNFKKTSGFQIVNRIAPNDIKQA